MNRQEQPEDLMSSGMKMVMAAGDARELAKRAIDQIVRADFDAARGLLAEAERALVSGHAVQTAVIQQECDGQTQGYNVLFAHGMDSLMTVKSEVAQAVSLLAIVEALSTRLSGLERLHSGATEGA